MHGLRLGLGLSGANGGAGAVVIPPLTPADWSSYLDADPDSHLSLTGANIDTYLDQSGNARNAVYASGTKNTRDTTNKLDGYNTMACGAYGEYRAALTSDLFTVGGGTIICVCKITDVAAARQLFDQRITSYLQMVVYDNAGTKFKFTLQDSGGAKNVEVAASTGAWQVLTARWNGSNIYAQCNYTAATPVAAGNVVSLANIGEIMGSSGTAQFAKGNAALFLTKASYLSDAQLVTALAQIKAKYASCGL